MTSYIYLIFRILTILFVVFCRADLFGEERGRGELEGAEEVVVGGEAGLEDEHAGVEVERWLGPHAGGPLDPLWALLAVPDLVLRAVAPRLLAEAVHHGVEIRVRILEQVVDVLKHLDVSVQVYHLAILHKLHALYIFALKSTV